MSGWPMVSLPHGAASAKKDLQKQIPFLQGYQEIVLFFDNDEAGRTATELASGILPPAGLRLLDLTITKMLQMPYKLVTLMRSGEPSGTPSHTDQTAS